MGPPNGVYARYVLKNLSAHQAGVLDALQRENSTMTETRRAIDKSGFRWRDGERDGLIQQSSKVEGGAEEEGCLI